MMLIVIVVFMVWVIGVNDSVKVVGIVVGFGIFGFKRVVFFIGVFVFLGVFFGGLGVFNMVSGLVRGMELVIIGLVFFSFVIIVILVSFWGNLIFII